MKDAGGEAASAPPRSIARRMLGPALAVAVSGYLLIYLSRRLQLEELLTALRALPSAGLAVVLLLYFLLGGLRALRFRLLLDEPGLPLGPLVPIALIHNLLVRTLPWLVGEVSYPALVRRHLGRSVDEGVSSLVGARVAELLFVIAGGLLGLLSLGRGRLIDRDLLLTVYAVGLGAALAGVFTLAPSLRLLARLLERLRLAAAAGFARSLSSRVAELWRSRLLVGNLGLTTLTYATSLCFHLLLLHLAGVGVPLGLQVAIVSLVTLVGVIPISVGGLGVVEGGWTYGLSVLGGLPLARAVTLAFLLHGVQLLAAVVTGAAGWAALLLGRRRS